MEQYRQGDVLIIPTTEVSSEGLRPHGDLTVAIGEATGHSHRFMDAGAIALYDAPDGDIIAEVSSDATIVHEEHASITIIPGTYRIRRQREYTPGAVRPVSD